MNESNSSNNPQDPLQGAFTWAIKTCNPLENLEVLWQSEQLNLYIYGGQLQIKILSTYYALHVFSLYIKNHFNSPKDINIQVVSTRIYVYQHGSWINADDVHEFFNKLNQQFWNAYNEMIKTTLQNENAWEGHFLPVYNENKSVCSPMSNTKLRALLYSFNKDASYNRKMFTTTL